MIERTAEEIKIRIGSASAGAGINHGSERPRSEFGIAQDLTIRSEEVREACKNRFQQIGIHPPDPRTLPRPNLPLILIDRGIVMVGGGGVVARH